MGYRNSIRIIAKELPVKSGTFLVTGATGLIGSCIIDILLCANMELDADFKIYALSRSHKKLENRFNKRVIPIVQDIITPLDLSLKFDFIINAASNADPRMYSLQPVETVLVNILGNKNILDYCKEHIKTRLLYTSTFEVYGKVLNNDIYTEDMAGVVDFQVLRNGYPESKRCAEILLKAYVEEYGIDAVVGRLASVYGPTMLKNDSKAHAQFIRNAINKENIVLKSEGLQKRTYCYVIDAASALFTILFKGESGEVYNVANENSVSTISGFAKICSDIVNVSVVFKLPDEIERKGFSKPQNCILSNEKLKKLGWNGKYSLADGINETIETLKLQI